MKEHKQESKTRTKTIVITGASDGIGKAAAKQLKSDGHNVIIVGRSAEKTKLVATDLDVPFYIADFSKLEDVKKLAKALIKDIPAIDVLCNNAGGIMSERSLTADGNEQTMQVNHYAPFLLTNLLMEKLIQSKASVINTASVANTLLSDFDINDLDLKKGYTPAKAYGNAKLADILFTKELHRRYFEKGIASVAFHPGNVATNFSQTSSSLFMRLVYRSPLRRFLISPEKGARTLVWLAETTPGKEWRPGEYYVGHKITKASKEAYNKELIKDFWLKSEQAVKLSEQL